jgi:hypothetical protein
MEKATYVFGEKATRVFGAGWSNVGLILGILIQPLPKTAVFICVMDELDEDTERQVGYLVRPILDGSISSDITVVNFESVKLLRDGPICKWVSGHSDELAMCTTLQDYFEFSRSEIKPDNEGYQLRYLSLQEYEAEVDPTIFKLETDPNYQLVWR